VGILSTTYLSLTLVFISCFILFACDSEVKNRYKTLVEFDIESIADEAGLE